MQDRLIAVARIPPLYDNATSPSIREIYVGFGANGGVGFLR